MRRSTSFKICAIDMAQVGHTHAVPIDPLVHWPGKWTVIKADVFKFHIAVKGVQWTNAKLHLHIPICLTYQTHIKQTSHANLIDYTGTSAVLHFCMLHQHQMSPETVSVNPRLPKVGCKITHEDLEPKRKIGNDSIGVSGSLNRWDWWWYIITQLAVYTTYIPLIYIATWGYYMLPIPPTKGTRKLH